MKLTEKKRVLVTGGGGFLGRHLIDKLLMNGLEVYQFSRSRYPDLEAKGVRTLQGDLQNYGSVTEAVAKVPPLHAVFHVAALTDMWGPWEKFYATNFLGTQNILQTCKEQGVPRFIYTSSPSVVFAGDDLKGNDERTPYPSRYLSFYAHTKSMAERLVLAHNDGFQFCTMALRPHLIWGPGDTHLVPTLVERARKGVLKQIGSGRNEVDVLYVENAALAHVQALEHLHPGSPLCGRSYFLGQERPVKLWDFVNVLLEIHGVPPVRKRIPGWAGYGLGLLCEKIYSTLGLYHRLPPMTRFVSLQLSKSHYFSHQQAQADFGHYPQVTIEEGLLRLKNHLESR